MRHSELEEWRHTDATYDAVLTYKVHTERNHYQWAVYLQI